jgi:hypothetical protein
MAFRIVVVQASHVQMTRWFYSTYTYCTVVLISAEALSLLLSQTNLAAHEQVPDGNRVEKKLGEEHLLCTSRTLKQTPYQGSLQAHLWASIRLAFL